MANSKHPDVQSIQKLLKCSNERAIFVYQNMDIDWSEATNGMIRREAKIVNLIYDEQGNLKDLKQVEKEMKASR